MPLCGRNHQLLLQHPDTSQPVHTAPKLNSLYQQPYGSKIDTGEVLHFHVLALIAENEFANRIANKLNIPVKRLLDTLLDDNTEYPKIEVPEKFQQKPPPPPA